MRTIFSSFFVIMIISSSTISTSNFPSLIFHNDFISTRADELEERRNQNQMWKSPISAKSNCDIQLDVVVVKIVIESHKKRVSILLLVYVRISSESSIKSVGNYCGILFKTLVNAWTKQPRKHEKFIWIGNFSSSLEEKFTRFSLRNSKLSSLLSHGYTCHQQPVTFMMYNIGMKMLMNRARSRK